jgi:hypothetical protein
MPKFGVLTSGISKKNEFQEFLEISRICKNFRNSRNISRILKKKEFLGTQ